MKTHLAPERCSISLGTIVTRAASLLLPMIFAGCAMPGKGGAIPTGQWAGEGFYIAESWDKPGQPPRTRDASEPTSGHARYPTTLLIRSSRVEGHDVTDIRIYSRHVNDPVFGKDTFAREEGVRLKAVLEQVKCLDECTVLYRLVDFDVGTEGRESAPPKYKPEPGIAATCITRGKECTLIINYNHEFVDTFQFEGREVEKTGSYFGDEKTNVGVFHWTERLRRTGG